MTLEFPLKKLLNTTPKHLAKLEALHVVTGRDLVEYFPRAVESTDVRSSFGAIEMDKKNTVGGLLCDFRLEKTARGRKIGKAALVLDDGVVMESVWFSVPYVLRNLRDESRVFLVGKVSRNYGKIQISNPEVHLDKTVHVGGVRAIYSESLPITSKWLREKMHGLLPLIQAHEYPEFLPASILEAESFLPRHEALKLIHAPTSVEAWNAARRRLAFEELFEIQLRVLQEKFLRQAEAENPFKVVFDAELVKQDLATLPFALTLAQKRVLFQILQDFQQPVAAHRLVQGDVGSGKTVVAFLAAAQMVRAGFQVAILAPTEILAQQHFEKAKQFFAHIDVGRTETPNLLGESNSGVVVELLTGSVTAKQKKDIKQRLVQKKVDVLIGTHALLTEDTVFHSLGLAVVDEQHRFGVAQRAILAENKSHVVSMTATPIPRTLALTIYGNQELSVINELPAGRKPIITRVVADDATERKMNLFIDDQCEKGRQVFWVCPLVEESEKIEAKSVLAEFERVRQIFAKRRVEYLHGKMRPAEKKQIMERFQRKEFDILVSTSVIEVGVDIPDSTVMVIENSERFGLSQLHQFRGRIGRNDLQSYCFLKVGKREDKQKIRLKAMERFTSGQKLSEIDLELRGMGEIYGVKQSGLPEFKVADISNLPLLESAKHWAEQILEADPHLEKHPLLAQRLQKQVVYFQ
ncbi:ATP-dependent DNA helicase RecG [bacterium DOLZORAL124_38_8]|nr:MAG: ATP-dependent DNA helicase RecG [bacterium DOLZORAL124_38_8]